MSDPPLLLDIDGTLTAADGGLAPSVFEPLRTWRAPLVVATGKAFPYPVALCHFLGLPPRIVAENGGIVCVDDHIERSTSTEQIEGLRGDLAAADVDLGWGPVDFVNRWRETELAIDREAIDRASLADIAADRGLEVVDSNYAFHVKAPDVDKGAGVAVAAAQLGFDLADAIAIGDSENDVEMFERAGTAIALANADERARAAADAVAEAGYAAGTVAVLEHHRGSASERN